jgi:hypothetical protein
VLINQKPTFTIEQKTDLLYGITEIKTPAQSLSYDKNGKLSVRDVVLTMIPYYAWSHRGSGEMLVWLPQTMGATSPETPPTLAKLSKLSASNMTNSISSIRDGLVPKNEDDHSIPYYHWWPKVGTTEWIAYEFDQPQTVSSSSVYWYDDAPWGDCRVPQSWKLYYKDDSGNWQPVANSNAYRLEKGDANTVTFAPVKTTAIKLEVVQQEKNSAGLFEWQVE